MKITDLVITSNKKEDMQKITSRSLKSRFLGHTSNVAFIFNRVLLT